MMRKNVLFLIPAVLLLSSCATFYNVQHREFDSIENPFTTDKVMFYQDILFSISVGKVNSKSSKYFTIEIVYNGSGWLFMDGSVVIQADDKIIKINDSKPHRMVLSGGRVQETVSAIINKQNLIGLTP